MIDERRVDERRVGRDAHDDVGVERLRGPREAREHVVFRAAHDGDAVARPNSTMASSRGLVVVATAISSIRCERLQAMHDVPEQRLAGDGLAAPCPAGASSPCGPG